MIMIMTILPRHRGYRHRRHRHPRCRADRHCHHRHHQRHCNFADFYIENMISELSVVHSVYSDFNIASTYPLLKSEGKQ